MSHKLLIDSKALFETLTTLLQADDYRLRKTVARIRASLESKELNVVRSIAGVVNYADVLTKRNSPLSKKPNDMLASGVSADEDEGAWNSTPRPGYDNLWFVLTRFNPSGWSVGLSHVTFPNYQCI